MGADEKMESHPSQRRILCIDGGGIIGTFPAAFLAAIEQHLQRPIGQYFDLIAGTSTGGIIAIGLALGIPASKICELYEKMGPKIFGQHHSRFTNSLFGVFRTFRRLYRHKYDSDELEKALVEILGEQRLGHATRRLVVPAWNPTQRSVYIYKTAHHPRLRNDYRVRAVDAALATSAAPTYFRRHVGPHDIGLIDGGVWANNPIAIAVVEAITLLGWPHESLRVLSLGCVDEVYELPNWAGVGTLGSKAIKLFMDGQSHGALGIAKLLTGDAHERSSIFRIANTDKIGKYRLDDARTISELKGLGYAYARFHFPFLDPAFFYEPAESFQPIYKLDDEVLE
jgi:hypothetical protein